ncbi:DUF3134 family protein [Oculatella sp. LEGE 06141]|uniref:DUF3134 family protein n=1 Tax=Oculatella sp. LEGE 06141 TaxID=1828648 RepID=UPI001880E448|nr:DUF3134 family protein [Oculatella sp. LEGE 06141]MBE9180913.1 DUF3134 family protein [Oculatella sp. LEGE 06141]
MVKLYNNPALRQEPLSQKAMVIAPREKESLLNWIENTGRFKAYEPTESHDDKVTEELEEIMGSSVYEVDKEDESEDWEL